MIGHSLLYLINICLFPTFSFRPFLNIHNVYDDLRYVILSTIFFISTCLCCSHLFILSIFFTFTCLWWFTWPLGLFLYIHWLSLDFPFDFFCQKDMNWFTTNFPKLNRQNTWKEYQKSYIRSVTVFLTKYFQFNYNLITQRERVEIKVIYVFL